MKYDLIYHLSHTDLDGYGSQYMTRLLGYKIKYFNANYDEVTEKVNDIYNLILENKNKKILFLITDLSINEQLAKKMNNFKRGNTNIELTYQVLDHHKTGEEISNQNDWYYYNIEKCGSSLTAEYVNENLNNNIKLKKHLSFVGDFIQSHDIWEKESPHFNFANLLSDIIFNLYFPDFMIEEKRNFLFNYIFVFISQYQLKETTVNEMEEQMVHILNKTLTLIMNNENILNDKNIRSLYKLYYYEAEVYSKIKNNFKTFNINGLKFQILYNSNSGFYQYFSHYFLENNSDIDFLINIKDSGTCSFRSVNKHADVEGIAKIFDENGGGHFHAAGCKIKFEEKVHSYVELTKEIEKKIKIYEKL